MITSTGWAASVRSQSAELDGFFLRHALHELTTAAGRIRAYAAVLEAQLADEPGVDVLRTMVRDLRGQAELVAGVVDQSLPETQVTS
jgi:hypothetical protein